MSALAGDTWVWSVQEGLGLERAEHGDTVFAAGALAFVAAILRATLGKPRAGAPLARASVSRPE